MDCKHDHGHDHHHDHKKDEKEEKAKEKVDVKQSILMKQTELQETLSSMFTGMSEMEDKNIANIKLIQEKFEMYVLKMGQRKEELIKQIQNIALDKKQILNDQIKGLQSYQKELESEVKKSESEMDPKLASKDITPQTKAEVQLKLDDEVICNQISRFGKLNNMFRPTAPAIEVTDIKAHTVRVRFFEGKSAYGGFQKSTEHIVEFAKGINVNYEKDEKEKDIDYDKLTWNQVAKKQSKRFVRISKLKPSTVYYCRVKCKNEYGWSDWCAPIRFVTYILKMDTKIMTSDEIQTLIDAVKAQTKRVNFQWKLLYRGSEDGFLAKTFHAKCDDIANTVCIVSSEFGNVFGGYTRLPWKSDVGRYHVDEEAFVFLLREKSKKLKEARVFTQYASSQHSVVHNKYMGPIFGYGHDIYIRNKCNEVSDNSCRNHTYQCTYAGELAGEEKYKVINYEVFEINFIK